MAVGHIEDKEAHAYIAEDDTDQYSAFSDPIGVIVEQKWRGTVQDKTDMEVLGRGQVDARNMLFININGGTADLFWGYIAAFVGLALTYASMSEMTSM
ncbi:MAG: hypothetical protein LQ346_005150 [Caloplaca aetnensis]|nr:MAG: hypothetical protein LQ346_005150 [Caloplaca aetnensis]